MMNRDDTRFAGYLIAGYLAFAEVLSWETSKWPACLVVSEYQSTDNNSGNHTCATLHEGIMRGLVFLWDHATHDNIIALGTVLIAIFTWTLWRSTSRLWNATNRSAEIAERALTDLEAPFIAVKIIKPGLAWDTLKTSLTWGPLQYSLVNYGRTPATLFELVEDIRAVKITEGGMPPHIKAQRGPPLPYGVFVPPNGGETRMFNFNVFGHMLGIAADNPGALKTTIPFFLGTARYGDIFGNLYVMGFCFIFDDVGNRFIEAGGSEYNYCRKESGPYRPPGSTAS